MVYLVVKKGVRRERGEWEREFASFCAISRFDGEHDGVRERVVLVD
jgi:hypothetical protein